MKDETIKELAQDLQAGYICHYDLNSGECVSLPHFEEGYITEDEEDELFGDDLKKLRSEKGNYIRISPMTSNESFEVMENFMQQMTDTQFQLRLYNALNNRKPFKHFNALIHNSDHRESWFAYKNEATEHHVMHILKQHAVD